MDPNEATPIAPERCLITEQYLDWLNEEELKRPTLWSEGVLIVDTDPAFCTCENDNICEPCRKVRRAKFDARIARIVGRPVILQEDGQPVMFDEVDIEARIDDQLAFGFAAGRAA